MSYTIKYEEQDLHWQVITTVSATNPKAYDRRIAMRFPTKKQAISYIDSGLRTYIQKEIKQITENEDNSKKRD